MSGIRVVPVILCGGSGTRLWPLSRTGFPKQFLCLTGDESLFQQAARRLVNLGQIATPASQSRNDDFTISPLFIVTGEEHRFLASEQLREAGIAMGAALLEPVGRNTAPALTLAALAAIENGGDPVLVVSPADQTVSDTAAFTSAMQAAVREAEQGTQNAWQARTRDANATTNFMRPGKEEFAAFTAEEALIFKRWHAH